MPDEDTELRDCRTDGLEPGVLEDDYMTTNYNRKRLTYNHQSDMSKIRKNTQDSNRSQLLIDHKIWKPTTCRPPSGVHIGRSRAFNKRPRRASVYKFELRLKEQA
ncbi:unnamed protein product [Dibothriocephalus latus]|uniref:Uncharacterized protein n=1 Tax=Dibothriocephalus latus TaxID=60516 RepID=A0A3P6UQX6_DIBLA|nr:unnamed protein product [Dibothriocephalus latus]